MDGKLYYTFKAPKQDVRFFALESVYLDADAACSGSRRSCRSSRRGLEDPLLPSPALFVGRAARLGSDDCATALEPLFVKYGVSVVFTGHDHFYERIKPQKGIVYFVAGSGGQLRKGNIDASIGLTADGFDTDQAFLAAEIDGDELFFNAISRTGQGRSTPASSSGGSSSSVPLR